MAYYEDTKMYFRIYKGDYKRWPAYGEDHFHDCYEFYYLIEGSVFYHIGENVYSVEQGDIVLIPPNVPHKTRPNKNDKYKHILMYIRPEYIQDFIQEVPDLSDLFYKINIIRLDSKESCFADFILDKIIDEFSKTPDHNDTIIKSYVTALFLSLSDCVKQTDNGISTNSKNVSDSMQEIMDYINTSFAEEITLGTLAKKFYLHPSYISNMIKKNLGISFVEYLNRVRIQKSFELLLTTDDKIEDIAAKCGFSSGSRYCKIFASYLSTSPAKYRKNATQLKKD